MKYCPYYLEYLEGFDTSFIGYIKFIISVLLNTGFKSVLALIGIHIARVAIFAGLFYMFYNMGTVNNVISAFLINTISWFIELVVGWKMMQQHREALSIIMK